jgi:hypothetical protein
MPLAHSTRTIAARAVLPTLFVVLVVLEVAPIIAVIVTDALWFMWVPEEFTATLWPPLKPLLPGSYFYHYFGFAYYTVLRPAHWLTEWLLGSPEVTITYTQTYGTIIKIAFSAATISLAAWVLATRALAWRAKAATLIFMLAMLIANPDFYWIYHARVSYALSVKLFATLLMILTLVCAENALEGRQLGAGMTSAVGALAGVLFFEHLLYFPLVIYPTLLIVATTPLHQMPRTALLGIATALLSALVVLAVFYNGDTDSIIAAVSSHIVGIVSGNPLSQLGHHEHFVSLFLNRRSVYFACHVILVAGTLVALVVLAACLLSVRRYGFDRTTTVLALFLLSHLANVGAYVWPLLKHGTNATVYAATIESTFFVVATATATVGARPTWVRKFGAAMIAIAATATAVLAIHNAVPPYGLSRVNYAAIGAAVREFDDLLNELADRYAVVDAGPETFYMNDHVLYWPLRASEVFNNTASGLGGLIDDRYRGTLQHERHPRYRFWQPGGVTDVADRCYVPSACGRLPFAFGARYANLHTNPPPSGSGEAWIEPLPADAAAPLLSKRTEVTLIRYRDARGRARDTLLSNYPYEGLIGQPVGPSARPHWSMVPLQSDDVARVSSLNTKDFGSNHVPFLASVVGYRVTYYLIWLPLNR